MKFYQADIMNKFKYLYTEVSSFREVPLYIKVSLFKGVLYSHCRHHYVNLNIDHVIVCVPYACMFNSELILVYD